MNKNCYHNAVYAFVFFKSQSKSHIRTTATTAASDAKGVALDRFSQLKQAAGDSYDSLKKNGVKSWASENLTAAKGVAMRSLDICVIRLYFFRVFERSFKTKAENKG